MSSGASLCIICESEVPSDDLAAHFEACFEQHCPATSETFCPPIVSPPRTVAPLEIGDVRLPSSARELIFDGFAPPELMQAAAVNRGFYDLAHGMHYHWKRCIDRLWHLIHFSHFDVTSTNSCGCSFHMPRLQDSYLPKVAWALWRAWTCSRVHIHVKTLHNRVHSVVLDEESGQGILTMLSVAHVKQLIESTEGVPSSLCALLCRGARILKHVSAPLACYVWDVAQQSPGDCSLTVHLDVVLRMNVGNCTGGLATTVSDFTNIAASKPLPDQSWRAYQDFGGRHWFSRPRTSVHGGRMVVHQNTVVEWFYEHLAAIKGWRQFRSVGVCGTRWWWHARTGSWFFDPRDVSNSS